jgi:hypothetical protein
MSNKNNKPDSKEDLILTLWKECKSDSAGQGELIHIQRTLSDSLGVLESPARIARTLADYQVPLRHPEILAIDAKWRETQINEWPDLRKFDFETVENAISSMKRLEILRLRFSSESNDLGLQIVVEQARELKLEMARKGNEFAKELVQWLTIWLQNPEIFADWLELRQNSPEFRQRFSSEN